MKRSAGSSFTKNLLATKQKTDAQTVADHASQRQSQQQSNPFLKQPVNPEDVRTRTNKKLLNYNNNYNYNMCIRTID